MGILLLDDKDDVVEANQAAREFVGARHGAALAAARIRQLAAEARAGSAPVIAELEVRSPTPRALRVTATPFDGWVVAYVEDVSERKHVAAARTDFVANVSHELKTPLGALSLLAETLAKAPDSETRARLIARIGDQAARMTQLVDDILDLSVVEAAAFEPAIVDLNKVVSEAAAGVRDLATASGVLLNVALTEEDVKVRGDERQLVSAISNLLANAVAYTADATPPRKAEVKTRLAEGSVLVEVEDTGIGIPVAHQQRIFERFYRVDRARSRETGGTGLGLAIVRHVAINHGGTVEVESESGIGSTFRMTIPLGDDEA